VCGLCVEAGLCVGGGEGGMCVWRGGTSLCAPESPSLPCAPNITQTCRACHINALLHTNVFTQEASYCLQQCSEVPSTGAPVLPAFSCV
jgi:hypothetical protein